VQNVVVVFGTVFDQLGVEGLGLFLEVGGNVADYVLRANRVVGPDDGLHGHQIDDSVKLIFLSDGNLNGDGLGIEALAESIDGVLESAPILSILLMKQMRGTPYLSA